jgi:O-antigen/teichoic acid export membrane protein
MIALPFILNALFNFAVGLLIAKFLGPTEFGYYAFAASIAVSIATVSFDWIRLSATRFYSDHDLETQPEIRATLNAAFAFVAALGIFVALVIYVFGFGGPLPSSLLALAVVLAVATGIFDFSTALLRARFLDRAYGIFIITKNLLWIILAVGGAWYFHSAAIALTGTILSVVITFATSEKTLRDPNANFRRARRGLAMRYAGYGLPLVLSATLYQLVPMMNRGFVAHIHNYAEAGKYSLAFDVGIRIVSAIGSAADVILFQLAVRAEKTDGAGAARDFISRNMGIVFAITAPAIAGCWLVMPSFERLLVPGPFRGAFAYYFVLMTPAMLSFALTNFALVPAFQIAHRTVPLILCALVALIADLLAIRLLPPSHDATTFALAQSISSGAGFVATVGYLLAFEPIWPRARDIGGAVAATTAMILAVLPLRGMTPGLGALLAQVCIGLFVYAAVAILLDIGGFRNMLITALKHGPRLAAGTALAGPKRVADESCGEQDRRAQ